MNDILISYLQVTTKMLVINTSSDRAATPLDPGLERIGTLVPRSADEVNTSNWTLGCETLDRDFANYDAYKAYILPLGIKTVRFQGGWAKTERTKGVYDFAWLDAIIDDAFGKGLNILLETDYGNPIYAGGGGFDLAGGFPASEEALVAWDRWVEAMALRYKGKVCDWAMWNEPDINKSHTPSDIATFNIRTAEIVKRIIPEARIAGLSLASSDPNLLDQCLAEIAAQGKTSLFHWFIYHGYKANPGDSYGNVENLKSTLVKYSATAQMRQGENGCPSETTSRFALSGHPWTEASQAKWDLRRMLGDLGHDVESAVFTICDFNHKDREINRKGLLHATPEKQVDGIKLAYYAVQNTVAVFDDSLDRVKDAAVDVAFPRKISSFVYRNRSDGRVLVTLWDDSGIPSDSYETHPAQVRLDGVSLEDPVWVDLVSGRIYAIPSERVSHVGTVQVFENVPIYDSPVLIVERKLVLK